MEQTESDPEQQIRTANLQQKHLTEVHFVNQLKPQVTGFRGRVETKVFKKIEFL